MSTPKLSAQLPEYLLQLSLLHLVTRSAPFTHTKTIPLHALSHLVGNYIQLLATTAQQSAEQSGRTGVSVWDVGNALEEFGVGGLGELRAEMERSQGEAERDEAERIAQLAVQLRDAVDVPPAADPIARLTFQPITKQELAQLKPSNKSVKAESQRAPSSSSSHFASSDDESDAVAEQQQLAQATDDAAAAVELKSANADFSFDAYPPIEVDAPLPPSALPEEDADESAFSLWSDRSAIPSYVPHFLPPFPGHERQRDLPEAVRRKREREAEQRDALQVDRVWTAAGAKANDAPWEKPIAYAKSMLAQMHPPEALPPLSPLPEEEEELIDGEGRPTRRRRRRVRSVSPPAVASSSLGSYAEAAATVLQGEAQWERKANHERRLAAWKIGQPVDLITGDSLFGIVPLTSARSAQLTAGFLQDGYDKILHPFNTQLPHTISHPVPIHPSPHALLLGPPMHNRMPAVMSGLVSQLGGTGSKNLSVFTRMLRMAPPSGLLPNGEPADFEYLPNTTVVDLAVEWNDRAKDRPLPGKSGAQAEASGPIKLRLGRGGSQTPAASGQTPGQTPAGGWTPALSQPPEELEPFVEEAEAEGAGMDAQYEQEQQQAQVELVEGEHNPASATIAQEIKQEENGDLFDADGSFDRSGVESLDYTPVQADNAQLAEAPPNAIEAYDDAVPQAQEQAEEVAGDGTDPAFALLQSGMMDFGQYEAGDESREEVVGETGAEDGTGALGTSAEQGAEGTQVAQEEHAQLGEGEQGGAVPEAL